MWYPKNDNGEVEERVSYAYLPQMSLNAMQAAQPPAMRIMCAARPMTMPGG